jgi:sugar-specific transcriptional regulator TrmB
MLKALLDLGLAQRDAEVYVFLALNGSKNTSDIADALNTYKNKVGQILKKLQDRQIVFVTPSPPTQFSAVPFDQVLDLLVRDTVEEANRLERKKKKIFALWKESVKNN